MPQNIDRKPGAMFMSVRADIWSGGEKLCL